jgi:hypothetical protein
MHSNHPETTVPAGRVRLPAHAAAMNEPQWVQFSGPGTKRKRAELACVACHAKKVGLDAILPCCSYILTLADPMRPASQKQPRSEPLHQLCFCRERLSVGPAFGRRSAAADNNAALGPLSGTKVVSPLRSKSRAHLPHTLQRPAIPSALRPWSRTRTALAPTRTAQKLPGLKRLGVRRRQTCSMSILMRSCNPTGCLIPKGMGPPVS